MAALVLSRIVAIAILSMPAGYLFQEMDNQDWDAMQEYSREELVAYLESARLPGHLASMVIMFLVGCGAVACVEILAWLLRLPLAGSDSFKQGNPADWPQRVEGS